MIATKCLECGKEFQSYSANKRKYCSVECSRKAQGLKGKRWSKDEEGYIIANYSQMTSAQIAEHLNRTKAAIDMHIFYFLELRKKGYSQPFYCDYCGKKFIRPPSAMRKIWGNFCSRKCYSQWLTEHIIGEEHPLWRGGQSPYNGQWKRAKRQAQLRAKRQCERCGKTEIDNGRRLDVHHKIPIRRFLIADVAHSSRNLRCLCRECHIKAHHPFHL